MAWYSTSAWLCFELLGTYNLRTPVRDKHFGTGINEYWYKMEPYQSNFDINSVQIFWYF
ncbi:hypothetical protein Hanom_Chr07g00640951 [Helianthus anomalus]